MKNLVKDASMGSLKEALRQDIEITKLEKEDMRPVTLQVRESTVHIKKTFSMSPQLSLFEIVLLISYKTLKMVRAILQLSAQIMNHQLL